MTLIEEETSVPTSVAIQHLIGEVGAIVDSNTSLDILDSVIAHIEAMIGEASSEIESYSFMNNGNSEEGDESLYFHFLIWLCDHPKWNSSVNALLP